MTAEKREALFTKENMNKKEKFGERLIGNLKEGFRSIIEDKALETRRFIPIPEPPDFSRKRLIRLRSSYGMSQAGFAKMLKVSLKTVQNWEQGSRQPAQSTLRMLQILESPQVFESMIQNRREQKSDIQTTH